MTELSRSEHIVTSLLNGGGFPHAVRDPRVIETHISWVILTGPFAYKFKKPVNLGFADFSTLEKRRHFCERELALNRRLAPDLYLSVVPITGQPESPFLDGDGEPIDFCVKMRQFPQDNLLSERLNAVAITPDQIDRLADDVADFHRSLTPAHESTAHGAFNKIVQPAEENFESLADTLDPQTVEHCLAPLRDWTQRELNRCRDVFAKRRADGFIRECHGDMHAGNMAVIDDVITIFDCIEFNEDFRWIDLFDEIAFVAMDFIYRGRREFAWRFLNRYLERTGDYAGMRVLRFYAVYRALVRAKVAGIRLRQEPNDTEAAESLDAHLELAESFMARREPKLIITHGLSGSGKTTGSQDWIERNGAVRIRSDVERKRLLDEARTEDLYSPENIDRTYGTLEDLAAIILESGFPVVVDATFLKQRQRDRFCKLANRRDVEFGILDFQAELSTLRQRLRERNRQGDDPSDADVGVLEQQLQEQEPLTSDERPCMM